MLNEYLKKVLQKNDLTEQETEHLFSLILNGNVPDIQIAALLAAVRTKGIATEELVGGVRFLKAQMPFSTLSNISRTNVKLSNASSPNTSITNTSITTTDNRPVNNIVDIVGVGGDGGRTFNISTTAAIVAAAAGLVVAKHGARAATGRCGAADVLEALGYNLNATLESIKHSLVTTGIGFLFAPKLHPVLARVAPLRRQLGFRSIFNLLGPLCNPFSPSVILLGVSDVNEMLPIARAAMELGVRHGAVIRSDDGFDELSCFTPSSVIEFSNNGYRQYKIDPRKFYRAKDLDGTIEGDSPQFNARLIRDLFNGRKKGAARSVVTLNAGMAIRLADVAESLEQGIELAEMAIDSGAAIKKLDMLIDNSKELFRKNKPE